MNGTVKWFNSTKGYGFITSPESPSDIFVHISDVQEAGLDTLHDGQKLSFELKEHKGRQAAQKLVAQQD